MSYHTFVTMPSGAGSPATGNLVHLPENASAIYVTVLLISAIFQLLLSLLHARPLAIAGSRGGAVMGTNGLTLRRRRARWVNTRRPLFSRRRRRRRGAIEQHASVGRAADAAAAAADDAAAADALHEQKQVVSREADAARKRRSRAARCRARRRRGDRSSRSEQGGASRG